MGIIAKIENERAVNDIDNIINNSDGILIARGDLGFELPVERIPGIQKSIINKCHQNGKFSIVAVDMIIQEEENDEPTRAEVSDIANAVLDGVDAIVLTGKTANGLYPVETIFTINKILDEAELDVDYYSFMDRAVRTENKDISGIIAHNVASSAIYLNCKAIYAPTITGYTARKISRFRPICPIIAASPNVETVKSLQLYFAVYPVLIHELHTFDKVIEAAKKMSQDVLDLNLNDKYIITGGYPFKDVKHTNFMKIEEL
jgi:pyruvate kinase